MQICWESPPCSWWTYWECTWFAWAPVHWPKWQWLEGSTQERREVTGSRGWGDFQEGEQVKNEHSLPARGKSFQIVKSRVDMLVLIRNKTKCHAWLLSNTYPRVVNALSNNGQAVFVHFVSSSCHVTGEFLFRIPRIRFVVLWQPQFGEWPFRATAIFSCALTRTR